MAAHYFNHIQIQSRNSRSTNQLRPLQPLSPHLTKSPFSRTKKATILPRVIITSPTTNANPLIKPFKPTNYKWRNYSIPKLALSSTTKLSNASTYFPPPTWKGRGNLKGRRLSDELIIKKSSAHTYKFSSIMIHPRVYINVREVYDNYKDLSIFKNFSHIQSRKPHYQPTWTITTFGPTPDKSSISKQNATSFLRSKLLLTILATSISQTFSNHKWWN